MEIGFNKRLLQLLKKETLSFQRYLGGQIKVIGFPGYLKTDTIVKDRISYAEWLMTKHKYPIIKLEGLEDSFKKYFLKFNPIDIHLFVNQKSTYSFPWHTDTVNVHLYVLKGFKRVEVKNKTYFLRPGNSALIPKGTIHRVFSRKDTWALSVGF